MRSLKLKKIEIKRPILQNLRYNLRKIIELAFSAEFYRLMNLYKLYQNKRIKKGLTSSQKKRSMVLIHKAEHLNQEFNKSICYCSAGAMCASLRELKEKGEIAPTERPIDLDMVWLPHYKEWFCVKCYETHYKTKFCEICWDTDDSIEEILECSLCEKYICGLCRIFCPECHRFYCEECFNNHLEYNKCGHFTIPNY